MFCFCSLFSDENRLAALLGSSSFSYPCPTSPSPPSVPRLPFLLRLRCFMSERNLSAKMESLKWTMSPPPTVRRPLLLPTFPFSRGWEEKGPLLSSPPSPLPFLHRSIFSPTRKNHHGDRQLPFQLLQRVFLSLLLHRVQDPSSSFLSFGLPLPPLNLLLRLFLLSLSVPSAVVLSSASTTSAR